MSKRLRELFDQYKADGYHEGIPHYNKESADELAHDLVRELVECERRRVIARDIVLQVKERMEALPKMPCGICKTPVPFDPETEDIFEHYCATCRVLHLGEPFDEDKDDIS